MGHWREPFPPKPEATKPKKPSVIAEVTALFRSIFHVEWLPFDETRAAFRRRFTGVRR